MATRVDGIKAIVECPWCNKHFLIELWEEDEVHPKDESIYCIHCNNKVIISTFNFEDTVNHVCMN